MVYVVNKNSDKILNRCDAWVLDAEHLMRKWASENGWVVTDVEITMMGDMVIWVE